MTNINVEGGLSRRNEKKKYLNENKQFTKGNINSLEPV